MTALDASGKARWKLAFEVVILLTGILRAAFRNQAYSAKVPWGASIAVGLHCADGSKTWFETKCLRRSRWGGRGLPLRARQDSQAEEGLEIRQESPVFAARFGGRRVFLAALPIGLVPQREQHMVRPVNSIKLLECSNLFKSLCLECL